MTKLELLDRLKELTKNAVAGFTLPVKPTEKEREPEPREADVYAPRLPKLKSFEAKAPFITIEIVECRDVLKQMELADGRRGVKYPESSAEVRTVFCVYDENEQEGARELLELMERVRIAYLERGGAGNQFRLDLDSGVESVIYPLNTTQSATGKFYLGETRSVWILPSVRRVPRPPTVEEYLEANRKDG